MTGLNDTNMIGHNQPLDNEGWEKKYFYMPMAEAELVLSMLEAFKLDIPKSQPDLHEAIQGRIDFIRRKMQ